MKAEDIQCPVCGYYCLGKGGMGCIDKPWMVENNIEVEDMSTPKWTTWALLMAVSAGVIVGIIVCQVWHG